MKFNLCFTDLYVVIADYTRVVHYQLVKLNVLMATVLVIIHGWENGRAYNHL